MQQNSLERYKGKYRIESSRLPGWDYAKGGKYFVTVNTRNRVCCFGDVVDGEMRLSKMGEIVLKYWMEIPDCFSDTYLDAFQIMPDHVHGIIDMKRPVHDRDETRSRLYHTPEPEPATPVNKQMSIISPKPGSLSVIIGGWKSKCTKEFNLSKYLWNGWQPRFYDHIIRNDGEMQRIQKYIRNNPKNWIPDP